MPKHESIHIDLSRLPATVTDKCGRCGGKLTDVAVIYDDLKQFFPTCSACVVKMLADIKAMAAKGKTP